LVNRTNDAKDIVRTWLDTWYDPDINSEHVCGGGKVLVGAELVLAHYHRDSPLKCIRKACEANAILHGLTYGEMHTVFYCQVPGCFWGALHRDGGDLGEVKTAIHQHYEGRHRQLLEPMASIATMLKPQAAVA